MRTAGFKHPTLSELAQASDGEAGSEVQEHLRRCSRCRTIAADYLWLTRELTAVFKLTAEAVSAPIPAWQPVRERLSAGRRQAVVMRLSIAACLLLAIGTMMFSSPAKEIVAQGLTSPPHAVEARLSYVPITRPVIHSPLGVAVATPTPALRLAVLPTPAPLLPPTPPDVEM